MSKRFLLLLIAALGLRLGWLAYVHQSGGGLYPYWDGDGYLKAADLFHHGHFLDEEQIERMPLYPALVAFIRRLPLPETYLVWGWHVWLDLIVLTCVYLFIRKFHGERAALLAGLAYAVYPLAWYRLPLLNTEIIQGAALGFWLLGAARVMESDEPRDAVILGLFSILLAFISPATQLLPLLFGLSFFVRRPFEKAGPLFAALLIPVALLALAWGARNAAVSGRFFLFDTRGGKEFWLGNNQAVDGRWEGEFRPLWEAQWQAHRQRVKNQGGDEIDINQYFYREGLNEIRANPRGAAVLFGKKFLRFWFVPASEQHIAAVTAVQSVFLLLAAFGLWKVGLRTRGTALPLLVILYYCAIYTLSYSCLRFSHPIMPWVCGLGGVGLARLGEKYAGVGS
ncbi:MAG TPA: hypothetical protein PK360_01800 [bacterium]|nr:hypothetical protein [bacterium]